MNKEEIYSVWVPDASPWSQWVKPVLFAHVDSFLSHVPVILETAEVDWVPPPGEKTALVLDLPGPEGVVTGVKLAARGYQPVPLYNALPLPVGEPSLDALGQNVAAVDVPPIISALRTGAEQLAKLNVPLDAPPVFLLDANRSADGRQMEEGEFDNRSICFTTDFPSANFLTAHGIRSVILIQRNRDQPRRDLAHILRRWQEAGIALKHKRIEFPDLPGVLWIKRPPWYGAMFQRALAAIGFHKATSGAFGGWMPDSSAGG